MTDDPLNQPPLRGDLDLWGEDVVLRSHAAALGDSLHDHALALGRAAFRTAAAEAERHPPEVRLFDRGGRRLDEVTFHPAYHALLSMGLSAGYAATPWSGAEHGHLHHGALVYLHSQVEPGTCCPMTMSYAATAALGRDPGFAPWVERLTTPNYDPSVRPMAQKRAVTMGMAMTEKQGGSDLRATSTRADPADGHYRLTGHKWFCSAPMSDAFLTLAQAPCGLTCFLVPRWLEDGKNPIHLLRLKDKLGNRANASAEIEYHGARAFRLGEEGDGIRAILPMVHHTRLDTALAPAGLMRAALSEAKYWCDHRSAFQRRLIDQPLMRSLLADLALDWEGATALGFYTAALFDRPEATPLARIAVALAKYLNNKRCIAVVGEAMEVLGGMGYITDTPLPLLYREAPLNGIWEGSGNVLCLDILRTLTRFDSAEALAEELDGVQGNLPTYDAALKAHRARWPGTVPEAEARLFAERTATLLTASVLIRNSPPAVAEAFTATRFGGARGLISGALAQFDTAPILARL